MNTRTTVASPLFHRIFAASACCVLLAGCGGGSHASLPAIPGHGTGSATSYAGSAPATFVFTFPKPSAASAKKRSPKYLSSATASITLLLTDTKNHGDSSDIFATVPAALKAQQNFNPANLTSSPTTPGQCGTDPSNAGNYECTAVFQLPVGDNTLTISSWQGANGTSNKLSQQITTVWTKQGVGNTYAISLDANAVSMAITATSGFCAGSFTVAAAGTVGTVGTTAVTFNANYLDPANKTIVASGRPLLTVNGHTDNNPGGGGNGYTDATTHLNVKVDQSSQTFTLTQTAGTGNAAVTVTSTPPSSDGLSFNNSLSFTFSSGPAPPASFLADGEQILNGSGNVTGGKISFWTIDGTGFHAGSPSSLSATPVAGPANSDVDFPNDLVFDGNSDLLIANGGSGSPDFGNFSCVPAGSITTGANNATLLTNNLDDPTHLAFSDPRTPANGGLNGDSSVALTNSAFTTYDAVEFVLSGTYTAAPTTRDVARVGNAGGLTVVALPASATNPSGSYAVSTYDGSTKTSKVQIIHPDGTTIALNDTLISHATLAYDKTNNELVIANDGRSLPSSTCSSNCYLQSNIQLWHIDPVSKASGNIATNTDDGGVSPPFGPLAVSATGSTAYVAVGVLGGNDELNVYTSNGTTLTQVGHSLDYGASDCASGGGSNPNEFYGGSTVNQNTITVLRFLGATNTLLVGIDSEAGAPPSESRSTANGMYLYDVSQTPSQPQTGARGCDGVDDVPLGTPTVNQTFFQVSSNRVLAAAYKP